METNGTPPPRPALPPVPPGPPPRYGLVISKRLLWVHGGAYPLENIVRVYTFVLRPRRGDAFARFLKRGGFTLALFLFLAYLSNPSSGGSDMEGSLGTVLFVVGMVLVYYFGDMASVVFARSHHVLAVETNGRSTALVTGKREHLNQLVRSIAEAIDEPDAEFKASVETLAVTNYGNYFFGDSVNMYGGSGNTGVAK
ncbi:hypothetical protein GCM10010275_11350 [Streptomyces litmocidini]|uniref:DUF6232 family protein n=1 Tax=Streptomyces litmocidini TaxID=67318 RepID=UPI0019A2FE31|nr:DUF6232 family protein [Streptomyces litmocidini]GGU78346.1 hypothetical protein GCM10010275_11350 [Streptomyces litmocidini]